MVIFTQFKGGLFFRMLALGSGWLYLPSAREGSFLECWPLGLDGHIYPIQGRPFFRMSALGSGWLYLPSAREGPF